jgi:DNA-binding MarR family transcriptional regulator
MAEKKSPAAAPVATPEPIDEVVRLLNLMTRFLAKLAEHPLFKTHNIGVTEWLFLRAMFNDPSQRRGQIARLLGITPQRTAQIVAALAKAEYVTVTTSADDTRKKDIAITEAGKAALGEIDQQLLALAGTAFQDKPKVVPRMVRDVRSLFAVANEASKSSQQAA